MHSHNQMKLWKSSLTRPFLSTNNFRISKLTDPWHEDNIPFDNIDSMKISIFCTSVPRSAKQFTKILIQLIGKKNTTPKHIKQMRKDDAVSANFFFALCRSSCNANQNNAKKDLNAIS